MSQTIQSIHSLSMQLNQAASLRGSSHLDELEPQMMGDDACGGYGQTTGGSGGGGKSVVSGGGGGKISKLFGKKASRVKELLLQNFGKADRTTDELFQMYEQNFYRQQNQALKLQKEFKSYVNSLKGAQEAGKSLNACIKQSTGDYQSARHDLVCENLSQLEHLDEDLLEKLRAQVLVSVGEYLTQFNELRDKIAKRRRKLIDYDSSRRVYELMLAHVSKKRQQQVAGSSGGGSLQPGGRNFRSALALSGGDQEEMSLQSATSQLVDEARLLKLREQYNYCKIMYDTINSELHEELPMVYEKKMKNLLMTLQNYFSLEAQFHSNAGKLFATASDVIDELPMATIQSHHDLNHHQHHHHHHDQHHHHNHDQHQLKGENLGGDHYAKTIASGSSGMGSSGGDSSLESSSSLSASGNGSPTGDDGERHQVAAPAGEEDDDEEGLHALHPVDRQVEPLDEPEEKDEEADGEEQVPEVDEMEEEHEPRQHSGKDFGPGETDAVSQEDAASAQQQQQQQKQQQQQQQHDQAVYSEIVDYSEVQGARDDDECNPGHEMEVVIDGHDEVETGRAEVTGELQPATTTIAAAAGPSLIADQEDHHHHHENDLLVACDQTTTGGEIHGPHDDGSQQIEDRKCLYKVRTSYKYLAEDVDELCFEADEIIQVIEFDENQEQEEGWLMGVREVNGQKGLFPANFTRPV